MQQFTVPQNLDIKDTLFLGLSFQQVIYLLGAGGVALGTLTLIPSKVIALLVASPFVTLALLLSFLRPNGQNFIVFFQGVILFFISHKLYIWEKSKSNTFVSPVAAKGTTSINSISTDIEMGIR